MMIVTGPHFCLYCDFIDPTHGGIALSAHFKEQHEAEVFAGLLKPIPFDHSRYHPNWGDPVCPDCRIHKLNEQIVQLNAAVTRCQERNTELVLNNRSLESQIEDMKRIAL